MLTLCWRAVQNIVQQHWSALTSHSDGVRQQTWASGIRTDTVLFISEVFRRIFRGLTSSRMPQTSTRTPKMIQKSPVGQAGFCIATSLLVFRNSNPSSRPRRPRFSTNLSFFIPISMVFFHFSPPQANFFDILRGAFPKSMHIFVNGSGSGLTKIPKKSPAALKNPFFL